MEENKNDISSYSQKPIDDDFANDYGFKIANSIDYDAETNFETDIEGDFFEEEELDSKGKHKKDKKNDKQKKNKSLVKSIIWIVSIVVVSLGLAFGVIYAGADFMGIGFGRGGEKVLVIEEGTPASQIAEQLEEIGAVKIPTLFRLYAKVKGYDSQFKYGHYFIDTEAGYDAICEKLITQGAKAETITVTIPEGTGINDFTKNVNGEKVVVKGIATILEEKGVCSKSDFFAALDNVKLNTKLLSNVDEARTYYPLEGYLFAETYEFFAYEDSAKSAEFAVKRMLEESEKRITDDMYKKAEKLGYSMNEVLTMASIIQLEAGIDAKTPEAKSRLADNMQGVASVFYNRLSSAETGGTLGSSPTLFYGDSFRNDDGRYNTQADNDFSAIKGLPPGPICSPGIDAINAALNPKTSEYLYFVTDSSGNFYFHKTMAEQNATIAKLKQGNQWIYEYFN